MKWKSCTARLFARTVWLVLLSRSMKFFSSNIGRGGRILRAVLGVALVIAGLAMAWYAPWVCVALAAAGVFALFEALRGWCLMRACGIKTRL